LALLQQLVPRAEKIGILLDGNQSDFADQLRDAEGAAASMARKLEVLERELAVQRTAMEKLKQRLQWEYPFQAATREPAKTSVSALRRRLPAAMDRAELKLESSDG